MLVIYYDIIVLKLHCDIAHFWKGMFKILSIHILKKSFSYVQTICMPCGVSNFSLSVLGYLQFIFLQLIFLTIDMKYPESIVNIDFTNTYLRNTVLL
jgi:hypothetical protein